MTATYRMVQFVPDPFSGWRVPVAALVQVGDEVRVVTSPFAPGPDCIGGRPRAALFRMMAEALATTTRFDALPSSLGPQAVLDEVRRAPVADLDAAARWVADHVLPQRVPADAKPRSTKGHAPARRMHGARFFETWNVKRYVEPTFQPAKDWSGRLKALEPYGAVSHWVPGKNAILLMEPSCRPVISSTTICARCRSCSRRTGTR